MSLSRAALRRCGYCRERLPRFLRNSTRTFLVFCFFFLPTLLSIRLRQNDFIQRVGKAFMWTNRLSLLPRLVRPAARPTLHRREFRSPVVVRSFVGSGCDGAACLSVAFARDRSPLFSIRLSDMTSSSISGGGSVPWRLVEHLIVVLGDREDVPRQQILLLTTHVVHLNAVPAVGVFCIPIAVSEREQAVVRGDIRKPLM